MTLKTEYGVRKAFLPPNSLLPHEQTIPERLDEVEDEMRRSGVVDVPVVVAMFEAFGKSYRLIADGHHRTAAAIRLGLANIPAVEVDLWDPRVTVTPWRAGEQIDKASACLAALRRMPFTPKTTRFRVAGLELSRCNTALEDLR